METYGWYKGEDGSIELVIQNSETLDNARILCENDFKARLINYNNNPVDRWCFSNSCIKVNEKRQGLIVKTNDEKKIDGAVTLVSLYEMYRRYRNELKSKWGLK